MAIATLSIDLIAKLASLEADFGKAVRLSEKANDRIQRQMKVTQDAVVGIGAALAGAFAGVQFVSGVKNIIDQIDALNDLADATGTTVEKASALEDVARRTGTTMDTVTGAMLKLNQQLSAAKPGSGVEAALDAIGLSADELKKLDPADALLKVSTALSGYADDGNKARLVQDLFGKSTREVAAFLKDLADKGALVGTVTETQAKEAEKFNQQLMALSKNLTDVGRAATSDFLPAINALFDRIGKQGGLGATMLANAGFDEFAIKRKELEGLTRQVSSTGAKLSEMQAAVGKDPFNPAYTIGVQALRTELADLMKKADDASAALKAMADVRLPSISSLLTSQAGAGRGVVNPPLVLPAFAGGGGGGGSGARPVALKQSDAVQAYIDKLKAAEESTRNLTEMEKLREAMTAANFAKITPAQRTQLELLARKIDLTKDPLLKAYQDEEARRITVLNSLLSATPTEQLEKARAEMQLLAEAFAAGTINAEQFNEAATVRLGLDKVPEQTDGKKATDSFLDQAERNIESRLSGSISSVFKGEFSSISKSFGDLMIDLAAQAAAAELANSLFGNKGADGTRSGGGLSDALSWAKLLFSANGNAFDAGGRISYFANGGVFGSPTAFQYGGGSLGVMGEAGPEAVMPLKRGKGGKLGIVAQGTGRAVVINQSLTFGDGVNRSELQQYGEAIKQQTLAAVYRGRTRGGAYE